MPVLAVEAAASTARGATGDMRVIWNILANFQRSSWNVGASVASTVIRVSSNLFPGFYQEDILPSLSVSAFTAIITTASAASDLPKSLKSAVQR